MLAVERRPKLGPKSHRTVWLWGRHQEKKKNPSAEAIVPGRFLWASGRSSEDRHGDFAWELRCGQGGWSLLNSFCFQSNTNFTATQSTCNMDSWLADGIHWICSMCRRIQCLICNLLDRWRSFLCQWSEPQFRIMAKNHSRKLQSTWMKLGEVNWSKLLFCWNMSQSRAFFWIKELNSKDCRWLATTYYCIVVGYFCQVPLILMGLWTLAIAVATIISWQSSNPHVRQWVRNLGMNHNDNETILRCYYLCAMSFSDGSWNWHYLSF